MRARITDAQLKALWESDRPRGIVEIWDTRVPGLVLRSQQTRMTWQIRYRLDGKQRRYKLGRYPQIGLKEARSRAVQAQRLVDEGTDPAIQATRAITFGQVAAHYMKVHAMPKKKTAAEDQRRLDLYILPLWENRPAASITRAEVRQLLESMARKTPIAANRVRTMLHTLFDVAILDELVTKNPVAGVPRPARERARTRILSDEEIRDVWRWCEGYDHTSSRAVRFLLLTGQRIGTLRGMTWEEIDGSWWTIPRARMKANHRSEDHRVFLSTLALEVLEDLRGLSQYVFPRRWDPKKSISRVGDLTLRIYKELDQPEWSAHDLRRTCATGLRSLGTARDIISTILDHAEAGVTGQHYLDPSAYDREVSRALEAWGIHVAEVTRTPASGHPCASVHPLGSRAPGVTGRRSASGTTSSD